MRINGKRVVDARVNLHISVSKQDARLGKNKDPAKCAAARAIVRTLADAKGARVHLGRTYVEYPDKWVRYRTPGSLRLEIVSFDRGGIKEHAEGVYTLYAPSSTDRLNHPRQINKPTGKTGSAKRRPHIARVYHQIEGVRAHGANK
jgi:hypothetical protein